MASRITTAGACIDVVAEIEDFLASEADNADLVKLKVKYRRATSVGVVAMNLFVDS